MAVIISEIAELAAQLGIDNMVRDLVKGREISAETSAANTALETFFDGAESLNTPANRSAINIAYRMGYAGHWA